VVAWPSDSTLVPENGGHPVGDERWARLYLAFSVVAFGCYLVGVLAVRRGARVAVVAALAVAIQLTPLAAPLLLSTDAWTYWAYGRIATVHDGNPYADPPDEFAQDPAFPYVGTDWRGSTSVYGPAFMLPAQPVAVAAGESADAAAWLFKGLAAIAMLVAVWLAARLSPRPALAAALVGWNPLLALHFAGGGHNDAWMVALVLAALALAASGRRHLAGVAWALAVLVKWVPLLLLPLRALEARGRRRVGHLGFAAAMLAVAALATWHYGLAWLTSFGPLAENATRTTGYALPSRLASLGVPEEIAIALFALAYVGAYAWLARSALRGRARLGLAMGLLLLATPYLTPWYVVWALPLAAAEDDEPAQLLALALCAYLLPQTVPV
jgi:Glycosyltransferase family 87